MQVSRSARRFACHFSLIDMYYCGGGEEDYEAPGCITVSSEYECEIATLDSSVCPSLDCCSVTSIGT